VADGKKFPASENRQARTAGAKATLADAEVVPSKSKAQNFLTQGAIADRIVDAAALAPTDIVIEIGPGLGILSERIAARGVRRLVLVELDRALAERLASAFSGNPSVEVVEADFLDLNLAATLSTPAKVIGNLPFNSASAIFRKLCDHQALLSLMVLMFQREVGERIRARPGDTAYSALSVFASLYFEIDLHFRVSAGSFHPKPKVDAEVLRMRPLSDLLFHPAEEAAVLKTVRASFSAPRKMIRNSLAQGLGIDGNAAAAMLARAGIDPSVRAESLSPADFVRLARAISKR
jgi:16S rRNA (adenine1518-N6/adenine1519-N6)-dimethyltransferase